MTRTTRKDEIIQVAAALFNERGYSAVSMRDIAQEVGIKAASLYNHIDSKQELLATIVMTLARTFTSGMDRVVSTADSPVSKIRQLIEMHIDITVNNSQALASLNNDWMHLEADDLGAFLKMREDYEENFRRIIRQGIEKGEIKKRHPEVILFSMLSTLRTLYLWYEKRGKLDVNILKKDMVAVLLEGVV
jgi:AcrR family transcriptional regulator